MRVSKRLRENWVWMLGHASPQLGCRVHEIRDGKIVAGGKPLDPVRSGIDPDMDDPVTADGLPRTARAMWGGEAAEALYGALYAENDCYGWHIRRSNFNITEYFKTEKEAWLAACEAAPKKESQQ